MHYQLSTPGGSNRKIYTPDLLRTCFIYDVTCQLDRIRDINDRTEEDISEVTSLLSVLDVDAARSPALNGDADSRSALDAEAFGHSALDEDASRHQSR